MAARKKKSARRGAKRAGTTARRTSRELDDLMSANERRQMLKPRDNYDDIVEKIARILRASPRIKIDGVKPARLEKLLRDAEKANAKESDLREKTARKLAPLVDRRMRAEDALWRAVLDVNAGVKPYARRDPSIADAFSFLTAALAGSRAERPDADQPSE